MIDILASGVQSIGMLMKTGLRDGACAVMSSISQRMYGERTFVVINGVLRQYDISLGNYRATSA